MKQAESNIRYAFYTGLILAMMVIALGACDGGLTSPGQEPDDLTGVSETGVPAIGYNQGDLVKVRVNVPKQDQASNSSRSVNPANVRTLVQFYEVVFANAAGTAYYRGEAAASQGYINVDVPVGTDYDVLLLAGRTNRTLLAAGYLASQNIEAGKVNVVSITAAGITPVWDTGSGGDFTFAGTGTIASLVAVDAANRYVRVGSDTTLPAATDTFTVTFSLAKLTPLITAENGSLTLQGSKVELLSRNADVDYFDPITFTAAPVLPYTIASAAATSIVFTSAAGLPQRHTDGVLHFALTYTAFGTAITPTRGGAYTSWTIMNGINYEEDKPVPTGAEDKLGGSIVVQIGSGSPLSTTVPTS
ncbi:hypothetical protein Holit_03063 [Hollandina sp. SP2]